MTFAGTLLIAAIASSPNLIEPPSFGGAALLVEEDAFNQPPLRITDQNYTGGAALQLSGSAFKWASIPLEAIDTFTGLQRALDGLDQEEGRTYRGYSLALGMTVFTPQDLRAYDVIPEDRPYAALEFLTATRTSAFERLGVAISTEDLTVGVLGFDQGHQAQAFIHKLIRAAKQCDDSEDGCNPHDPKGWAHQISNGGEPTLRYGLTFEKRLIDARGGDPWRFDLKGIGHLDLGYYTGAAAGFSFRAGLIRTPFWAYNTAPLNGQNQNIPGVAATPEQSQARTSSGAFEAYLFGALRGRVVGYNALLQGQFRDSDLRMSDGKVIPLLYEFEAGLTLDWHGWGLTVMPLAGRSPEFRAGLPIRHHLWSNIYLFYRAG